MARLDGDSLRCFKKKLDGKHNKSGLFFMREKLLRTIKKANKKPIKPHIKNTAGGSRKQILFVFDIKRVIGCKRRVITFDSDGHKARFTQKGNQVRLK